MARQVLTDQQPRMDGGLNNVSDFPAMQPNQLRQTINARLTDYGAIIKRGGTQRTSAAALAAAPILNGFTFQQDSGTNQILVISNTDLFTATYGTFPMTYTNRGGTFSSTVAPDFAQFRNTAGTDVVYIADGGYLNVWTGAALSTLAAPTAQVDTIQVHNERLWGCGNSSFPDSIFYSALNNGDTLGDATAGGGQIVVRTFGDEKIIGLASVNTSLLIFHRRGISRLTGYGQDDITAAPAGLTADVGTIAAKAIVANDNIAYFISERGLYRCNESEVAPVATATTPDPLLPLIRNLSSADFDKIRAVFNRATKELWITLPGKGCYQYHTVLNAWSGPWNNGYTSPDTTALFETLSGNGLPIILKGDASGWVSLCDIQDTTAASAKDNVAANGTGGTDYTMEVQLRRMYFGDYNVAKSFKWGYVTTTMVGGEPMTVEWQPSSAIGRTVYTVTEFDPTASLTKNLRIPMSGSGYWVDVWITSSGAFSGIPVLSNFQLEAFAMGRR